MAERSMITCPACGHHESEIIPADVCQYFYKCKACGVVMRPVNGDCCIFCSYGDVKCATAHRNVRGRKESGARPGSWFVI